MGVARVFKYARDGLAQKDKPLGHALFNGPARLLCAEHGGQGAFRRAQGGQDAGNVSRPGANARGRAPLRPGKEKLRAPTLRAGGELRGHGPLRAEFDGLYLIPAEQGRAALPLFAKIRAPGVVPRFAALFKEPKVPLAALAHEKKQELRAAFRRALWQRGGKKRIERGPLLCGLSPRRGCLRGRVRGQGRVRALLLGLGPSRLLLCGRSLKEPLGPCREKQARRHREDRGQEDGRYVFHRIQHSNAAPLFDGPCPICCP